MLNQLSCLYSSCMHDHVVTAYLSLTCCDNHRLIYDHMRPIHVDWIFPQILLKLAGFPDNIVGAYCD